MLGLPADSEVRRVEVRVAYLFAFVRYVYTDLNTLSVLALPYFTLQVFATHNPLPPLSVVTIDPPPPLRRSHTIILLSPARQRSHRAQGLHGLQQHGPAAGDCEDGGHPLPGGESAGRDVMAHMKPLHCHINNLPQQKSVPQDFQPSANRQPPSSHQPTHLAHVKPPHQPTDATHRPGRGPPWPRRRRVPPRTPPDPAEAAGSAAGTQDSRGMPDSGR
jgi:hypothetical protein